MQKIKNFSGKEDSRIVRVRHLEFSDDADIMLDGFLNIQLARVLHAHKLIGRKESFLEKLTKRLTRINNQLA